MATSMGIRELRDTLTATIRRVQRGETIEVTHHGAPVAMLAPVPADRISRLVSSGDVSAPRRVGRRPRRYPVTGDLSATEALAEDRADR
jgi:prevent-host-death family protein